MDVDDSDPQAPEEQQPHMTAWHVFLTELLLHFSDQQRLAVRDFVKLGSLPLEADVILLLLRDLEPQGRRLHPMLNFLEVRLRPVTVIEFKSPRDVMSRRSVDMLRVYMLLAKHKFKQPLDRSVGGVLLYSHVQKGLFEDLASDGLTFEEEERGIRCHRGSLVLYAVNLMELGRLHPESPLNLVSGRHAKYRPALAENAELLALTERIRYLILKGKVRGMALEQLPGYEEVLQDVDALRRRFLEGFSPQELRERLSLKERLEGLRPQERLEGLRPQERLEGLRPQERLEGLRPQERLEGLRPQERLEGLRPQERLEGLTAKEREELLTLLQTSFKR